MEKKKCIKCNKEIDTKMTFCPHCGKKVINKDKNKDDKWNFDNKIIFLFFWIMTIFGSYILSSPGFANPARFAILYRYRTIIGFVLLIIGCLFGFILNKKDILIKEEIDKLKKLEITRVQIGIMFIIMSIATLFKFGSLSQSGGTYYLSCVLIIGAIAGIIMVIIMNNRSKLPIIGQILTFIGSIISFVVAISLYNYGNELNHNFDSKLESFFKSGNANPGDTYINYALYAVIIGIFLLVLFFIIRTRKKKV